ncbi:MAG: hypothetical protein M1822_001566 [Bathelium mastoideum]|nr:MAG: hypothetical protein M1822_001566 [Bathelium mastoideum]
MQPASSAGDDASSLSAITESPTTQAKAKQKRNKPTLSCNQCVERKTKCDRARPTCIACIKRQSECYYSQAANLIASTGHAAAGNARYINRPPKRIKTGTGGNGTAVSPPHGSKTLPRRSLSQSSPRSSPFLLSNAPYTKSTPSNVFGIGSEHPFANYWTCQGGLPEVVGVLPSKDQADILTERYFTCVDPVYPMLCRQSFYADYETFWSAPLAGKHHADASMLALHFVIYAMGTQFVQLNSYKDRSQTSEFYVSAAHQALSISSYMNRTTMHTIQAMVLIAYFLMNDNHASDAWAFAGILLRQAYAMGLNRDPDTIVPHASFAEKQQRRKLWQAVMFQDTFLTVLLKLPPTATHSDVSVDALVEDLPEANSPLDSNGSTSTTTMSPTGPFPSPLPTPRSLNQMSISAVCANPSPLTHSRSPSTATTTSHHALSPSTSRSDIAYIRSMWRLALTVQDAICSPLSLSLPLSSSPRHKAGLLAAFRTLRRSFPSRLTILDPQALTQLHARDPRVVRQNLFMTSNYFHCLMVLQADENPRAGVNGDVRGALEAAIEALGAFWKLRRLFEREAEVWWVFGHRAFEEALMMANILAGQQQRVEQRQPQNGDRMDDSSSSDGSMNAGEDGGEDLRPLFVKAKRDVERMLEFLERESGSVEMQRTRMEVLRAAYDRLRA